MSLLAGTGGRDTAPEFHFPNLTFNGRMKNITRKNSHQDSPGNELAVRHKEEPLKNEHLLKLWFLKHRDPQDPSGVTEGPNYFYDITKMSFTFPSESHVH